MQLRAIALHGEKTVPLEAVDFERPDNLVRGTILFARRIDVLDPQQPLAAVLSCF